MVSENETLDGSDGPSRLEQAREAIETVAETVQTTTRTVADAIEAGRRPGAPLYRLAEWTRAAPMHSLAIAFLFGILIGRRR
jgi:hypothetical protein